MAELTIEETVRKILPTLPLPIQKFFEQHKLSRMVPLLMERYALHIDQGAILERELTFLLIGIKNPDEFSEALYEQLPISRQTVRDIITDINKEVFMPLRAEEMKGTTEKISQLAESISSTPPPPQEVSTPPVPPLAITPPPVVIPPRPSPPRVPMPSYAYTPPTQTSRHINLLENDAPRSLPQVPNVAPRSIPPSPPVPIPEKMKEIEQASLMRRLLEDHEEPSPSLEDTKSAAHIDLDKTSVPPNLPGAMPGNSDVSDKVQVTPSSQSYSTDPYREPIDEK